MREDGEYDKSEYKERVAEIEAGISNRQPSRSNESRIEQLDIEATITPNATNFISNLARIWFDLAPELKPRFQKLILPVGCFL